MRVTIEESWEGEIGAYGPDELLKALTAQVGRRVGAIPHEHDHVLSPFPALREAVEEAGAIADDQFGRLVKDVQKLLEEK